jgi:hypothetical protein
MAIFVSDVFSGETSFVNLEAPVGETGAEWTVHPLYTSKLQVRTTPKLYYKSEQTGPTAYYPSGIPASSEYNVSADFVFEDVGTSANNFAIVGRLDTSSNDLYQALFSKATYQWRLFKLIDGVATLLGSYSQVVTVGTYSVRLEITDASKKVYINGIERISSTDNSITAAGRPGIRAGSGILGQTGLQLDNFVAEDIGGGTTPVTGSLSSTLADASLTSNTKAQIVGSLTGILSPTALSSPLSIVSPLGITADLGATLSGATLVSGGQ